MQSGGDSAVNVYSSQESVAAGISSPLRSLSFLLRREPGLSATPPLPDALPTQRMEGCRLRFVAQALHASPPAVVLVDGGRQIFVRLTTPISGQGAVAIPVGLEDELDLALRAARQDPTRLEKVVVVGTDALMSGAHSPLGDPRKAEGYAFAIGVLARVFEVLREARVNFVWRTRGGLSGPLPPALAAALQGASPWATVEIGIPSVDALLCRSLEGGFGASPEERLRLAHALSARGLSVRGLIDPLVPMLTDQRASLEPLLAAMAEAGIHRVGVRYLVLTRDKARSLARRLSRMQRALIQGCFAEQPWIPARPESVASFEQKSHKRLPVTLRQKGHARVVDIAGRHGVGVDVLDPVSTAQGEANASDRRGPADPTGAEPQPESNDASQPRKRRRARLALPQLDLFRGRR